MVASAVIRDSKAAITSLLPHGEGGLGLLFPDRKVHGEGGLSLGTNSSGLPIAVLSFQR